MLAIRYSSGVYQPNTRRASDKIAYPSDTVDQPIDEPCIYRLSSPCRIMLHLFQDASPGRTVTTGEEAKGDGKDN
jgi:hypothetical protein